MANGFNQLVQEPTRQCNTLDIVLCNEPVAICKCTVIAPFSTSDHCQVEFEVFRDCDADNDSRSDAKHCTRYNWETADCDGMNSYLASVNWYNLLTTNLTVDSLWLAFRDILQTAINRYVGSSIVCANDKPRTNKTWYPPNIKKAIARKRCLWREHRKHPNDPTVAAAYKAALGKCRCLIYKFELKKEQKVIDSKNTGAFYTFVNNKMSCKSGIGPLRDNQGAIVTGDLQRANLLNDYFSSACSVDNGITPAFAHLAPESAMLDCIDFTPETVFATTRKLRKNKSCGPDMVPPALLANLATSLAEPLSILFNSFMSVGRVPHDWLHAVVTPIYKGGDASSTTNYRPISLTSVVSKIMERIISADILTYLHMHKLISKQQHGFLAKRSTCTNLLEALNDWTLAIKNKKSIIVAYIDYQKAFDTVCHSKLFTKLAAYGITGKLLLWIKNFLTDRSQQTKVGSALSSKASLTSGVVQGSVLGPLLFLLYINDVATIVNDKYCKCQLYADDVKLYTIVESNEDASMLQMKLSDLCSWSEQWQLSISTHKCATMAIGPNARILDLHLNNSAIKQVNAAKDLGVTIDSTLKFTTHINSIVAKAYARANLIHRCFISRNIATLTRAFKVYVRPILEYASPVWSPVYITAIKQIESVQRRFTKRLPGLANLSYNDRLSKLHLESLEARRLRYDLILTYKILFGRTDMQSSDMFVFANNGHGTRGHKYKLLERQCRVNIREHYFSERVIPIWNCLPDDAEIFSNIRSFTHFVKRLDLTEFLKI